MWRVACGAHQPLHLIFHHHLNQRLALLIIVVHQLAYTLKPKLSAVCNHSLLSTAIAILLLL